MVNVVTAQTNLYPFSKLQEVGFEEVKLKDNFWLPKIRMIQTKGLPLLFNIAEQQGKIDNFRIVAKQKKGKIRLYNAADSDVYKLIEDAAYSLVSYWDEAIYKRIDSLIDIIAAAQAADGYINTQYMLPFSDEASPLPTDNKVKTFGYGPDVKWRSLYSEWPYGYSQLYSAGHLMEAAFAHYKATGKDKLLKVAMKLADNIVTNFDEEKIRNYGEHPQVEIGLMKMYELTGNKNYLQYANLFSRYVKFTRPVDIGNGQNKQPLAEQREAFGHCVRTAYIYSGATDVARATGANDLQTALQSLWKNITGSKMYIHGGTGNGTNAEQHGLNNELPLLNTYSESCAGIAQGQWNHRLNLLYRDASYADIVEIEMYNNALASIGADACTFFYSNKLNIDTVGRKNEHSGVRRSYLFCCPSKVPGFVTGINRWIYAKDETGIYINQLVGTEVNTKLNGQTFAFTTTTQYPWEGIYQFQINKSNANAFTIYLRLPASVTGATHLPNSPYYFQQIKMPAVTITVNGEIVKPVIDKSGYISIRRNWKKDDVLQLKFSMPVRRVYTNEIVKANTGRVALMRGPLLYSLEGADNNFNLLQFILPKKNTIATVDYSVLDEKITALRGKGLSNGKEVQFTAIPYYLWQNRGVHQLSTLVIEDESKVNKEKEKEIKKVNTNG